MRLRDRGMVKWAPYKSLPEQDDFLARMLEKRSQAEPPLLSEEMLEELDRRISSFQKEDPIEVVYHRLGHRLKEKDFFDYIDVERHRMVLQNHLSIPLKDIEDFH